MEVHPALLWNAVRDAALWFLALPLFELVGHAQLAGGRRFGENVGRWSRHRARSRACSRPRRYGGRLREAKAGERFGRGRARGPRGNGARSGERFSLQLGVFFRRLERLRGLLRGALRLFRETEAFA